MGVASVGPSDRGRWQLNPLCRMDPKLAQALTSDAESADQAVGAPSRTALGPEPRWNSSSVSVARMSQAPSSIETLAFVFTDLVGSTELVADLEASVGDDVLRDHLAQFRHRASIEPAVGR